MSASCRTVSFSFEPVRSECLRRTQWLHKGRPSCPFCTRHELAPWPKSDDNIYIIIYIYIYRRARCTTRTCGARSGSPQLHHETLSLPFFWVILVCTVGKHNVQRRSLHSKMLNHRMPDAVALALGHIGVQVQRRDSRISN